jgi:AbrB family looped-hinge helix DNA binding protein
LIRVHPWFISPGTALCDARINGNEIAMSISITLGKAGRLVVPKSIRDRLGLHEGSRLKLEIQGGEIHAVPEPDEVTIEFKDGFPAIGNPPSDIVQALKAERQERDERLTRIQPKD